MAGAGQTTSEKPRAEDLNGSRPVGVKGDFSIPDIAQVACRFVRQTRRPALIYQLGAGDPARDRFDVPITSRTVEQVERALGDDKFDDLDLVIHSSGGDINAAYRMMTLLRSRMTGKGKLIAWVPRKAQSSATLLCLGTDQILLGELASLGPLDAQVRMGTTDVGTANYISALHLLKGLSRLQQFALETFDEAAAHLYDHQSLQEDLLRYSVQFSGAVAAPLFARIDSEKVGLWDQMLKTGEFYGCDLLERGQLIRKWPRDVDPKKHISRVVHQLVFDYPSHEMALGLSQLRNELTLDARLMSARFRPISRLFGDYSSDTLIMLVRPTSPGDPAGAHSHDGITRDIWKWIGSDLGNPDIVNTETWTRFGHQLAVPEIVRTVDHHRYWMRVGLYRPPVTPRNPWREFVTRAANGGPAFQFAVNIGAPRQPSQANAI